MKFRGYLKRHKNRIMCMISAFVLFCGCVFSDALTVSASGIVTPTDNDFYVNYARPAVSDTQGYINLYMQSNANGLYVHTLFWNVTAILPDNSGDSVSNIPINAYITLRDYEFDFGGYGAYPDEVSFNYSLFRYNKAGTLEMLKQSVTEGITVNGTGVIVGWQAYGNVQVKDNRTNQNYPFSVFYSEDGTAKLMRDVIDLLQSDMISDINIRNTLNSILNSVDGLENQLTSVVNYLKSVDSKLTNIQEELEDIYSRLDEILEEEKKQTSWLEKIWNSIQEFFTPDEKDKETTDKLEEQSKEQSSQLDELNKQNQTEKLDPSTSSGSVDANVDTNAITNYGTVLQVVTNHDYVLRSMLLVVSVGLVAYVLFGKKK